MKLLYRERGQTVSVSSTACAVEWRRENERQSVCVTVYNLE